MSDDQNTHNGGGWQPHPQGEYDSDATAFVQLPEGMLDAPLAAPGHGYVPPQITVSPTTADATDPAATGAWVMPPEVTGTPGGGHAVRWPQAGTAAPEQSHGAESHGYDPRATGQWDFAEAEAAQPPMYGQGYEQGQGQGYEQGEAYERGQAYEQDYGHQYGQQAQQHEPQQHELHQNDPQSHEPQHSDVTGQWSIPVAEGDLPDESGEFTASSLASQWGGTPPATLPGGAPAPWATAAGAGAPWGAQAQEALHTAPAAPAVPEVLQAAHDAQHATQHATHDTLQAPAETPSPESSEPESRFEKTQLLRAIRIPSEDAPAAEPVQEPVHEAIQEPVEEPVAEAEPSDEPAEAVEVEAAPETAEVEETDGADEAPGVTETAEAAEAAEVPETADAEPVVADTDTDTVTAEPGDPAPTTLTPLHDDHPLVSYVLRVNGTDRPVTDAWIGESLLYVLRERLGLAGAKDGCSQGECGACNVQVDGRLVASCLVPAATTAGSEVRTVEGLAADGEPSDVQRALAACGAVQCGFCVPGMAMTVHDLLEGNPAPSDLEARRALCGNLCRCSGYRGVLDAVREVVAEREASATAAEPAEPAAHEEHGATARIPHQAGPYDAPGPEGPQGPYGGQDGGHA
ncbi:2Fe-2S iron-sulfur cluster-binding protein [Streptomyces sp. NPDC058308]|uniref:(2Fe-2S)-binding protein n=1 Tax=Streptomyces sp. NPDC058308 TaxID=3346440 RepID=UPI0036E8ABBD